MTTKNTPFSSDDGVPDTERVLTPIVIRIPITEMPPEYDPEVEQAPPTLRSWDLPSAPVTSYVRELSPESDRIYQSNDLRKVSK